MITQFIAKIVKFQRSGIIQGFENHQ